MKNPISPPDPAIPSGWRKLGWYERARQGDLVYDELLGGFRAILFTGFLANTCTVIRREDGTPPRWHFIARLSGSENHKGYSLYTPSGSQVGEIYPGDPDGEQGKQMAELIVKALNAATFIKP